MISILETISPAVVELRQYQLRPGRRDELIALFDREFVETQEATGMTVLGQFRDLDNPDRFIWLRGFADMDARQRALTAFYEGPVWAAHSDAANATMIDSDDVLLLRPCHRDARLEHALSCRRDVLDGDGVGIVVATIHTITRGTEPALCTFFESTMQPALEQGGMCLAGSYMTHPGPNNFPRLPIRDADNVFVWFASFLSDADYAQARSRVQADPVWSNSVGPALREFADGQPKVVRMRPTSRSLFDGRTRAVIEHPRVGVEQ